MRLSGGRELHTGMAVPGGMHDMTVEMLNDTPFVNLTGEQMEAFNAHLKNC